MTYGAEAYRVYVLGKGSAFGREVDPRPFAAAVESRAGVGAVLGVVRHAEIATKAATRVIDERIV
jgi:hypothetical protein